MELTYDIAQKMIQERIEQYPAVWKLVANPEFDATLQKILDFEHVDASFLEQIRFETLIILTVYAPLNEFEVNIAESTGPSIEQSENNTQSIKALLIPDDVLEDLIRAQIYLEEEMRENPDTVGIDGRAAALRDSLGSTKPIQGWEAQGLPINSQMPQVPLGEVPDADGAIRDELLLKPRMTEKIVSRAVPEPGAKPLTREDILRSLAAKRTLASDVSALQQNKEE